MSGDDRDREHHDLGSDPTTARIPGGTDLPAAEYTFDDEAPRLSVDDQRTVDALRPGTALLIVLRGPNTGARFLLDADEVTSGRHPHSDIFLDDVTVSRKHAQFVKEEEGYAVRDVGSLNGTYVNRQRIEQMPLNQGDEVQIGKFRLVYYRGRS
ncbi:FHA domain-containing protein [Serinicoccus hydrothermalis]|uniref:FHA domain-containing protein n=1 Tax=Serinicoccus hydrothermalis TaxID=1758689 RepID=UPI00082C671B|nr:FHA domain-containing protein [Serinicoccus hydrothermalis]